MQAAVTIASRMTVCLAHLVAATRRDHDQGFAEGALESLARSLARHDRRSGTEIVTLRPTRQVTAIGRRCGHRASISSASASTTAARWSCARSVSVMSVPKLSCRRGDRRPGGRAPRPAPVLVREAVQLGRQQDVGHELVARDEVEAASDVQHAGAVIEGLGDLRV
jgi:hypothetical protein